MSYGLSFFTKSNGLNPESVYTIIGKIRPTRAYKVSVKAVSTICFQATLNSGGITTRVAM